MRSLAPFPISLPRASPPLYALDAAPLAASLSVDHQARPPLVVLPSVKFSFRRARRSGYFVPFCRPITCLPYSLHAAVSARRYTQRKQAYSRSRAPYLYSSVSMFYTLKKSFAFYEKKLAKSLHISKILTTFANVRWKIKHLTRSLNLLYIYIGKIKKVRNWLQPVADGVKAKRFTAYSKRCKFSYFIRSLQVWRGFIRIKLFSHKYKYLII